MNVASISATSDAQGGVSVRDSMSAEGGVGDVEVVEAEEADMVIAKRMSAMGRCDVVCRCAPHLIICLEFE
jgi:hypothetical protein